MAKIKANVHLQDPNGRRVVLKTGDEIPEWADVADALIERPAAPAKKAPAKKRSSKRVAKKAPAKAVAESNSSENEAD